MKGSKISATLVVLLMVLSVVVVLNKVNMIEQASAISTGIVPGVTDWGNATTENLEYDPNTFVTITMNTTGMPAATYYLYKPSYNCSSSGTHSATQMDWFEQVIGENTLEATLTVATPGELKALSSKVKLDRAGLWAFSAVTPTINGSKRASFASYFWVNTSEGAYVIDAPIDFPYGSSGSKTITVTESGTPVICYIDLIDPLGKTVFHYYAAAPAGICTFGVDGNITMAGDYTIRAYKDLDGTMYYYFDEVDTTYSLPSSGYKGYNPTYGRFFSAALNNTLNTTADHWKYSVCGPWDPPEKNATEATFTVETGSISNDAMNIVLTNTTIFWGFKTRIDVNVTDASGKGLDLTNPIRLKNNSGAKYWTAADFRAKNVTINNDGNGNYSIEINRTVSGVADDWNTILANGTWYVYFTNNTHGGEEEWNSSTATQNKFVIKSTSPPVQLTITDDCSGTNRLDKKVDIPKYAATTGTTKTLDITFSIFGTSIANEEGRAYYGDGAGEDWRNITVSGDILYPVDGTTLTHSVNGDWTAKATPTKPGGTITIKIDWPGSDNGSASQTIDIINGTSVISSVDSFTVGEETTLTFTVQDMEGDFLKYANVYLMWRSDVAMTGTQFNSTTGDKTAGNGLNGEYSFIITTADQGVVAPKNITIAVYDTASTFSGYAKVIMEKNHNMMVNLTPTSAYAGDAVEYDITTTLVGGGSPDEDTRGDLQVAICDQNGDPVTDADVVSGLEDILTGVIKSGDATITDHELILAGGTYTIYAHNDTHDSQGHNATLTVTKYTVESSPDVLAWLIDTDVNITFQLTPAGNGTLTLNNVSGMEAAVAGTDTVDIENGIGAIEGLNASTLGNITFSYQPQSGDDRPADAKKLLRVTTATAIPSPATIYLGEPTTVTITVTHPATDAPLEGIRIGLDHGLNLSTTVLSKLPTDSFTDANGQAQFAITADASGDITIYIKNETDPDNEFVITAKARKTMAISTDSPTVDETTGTFTVEAKSGGALITDATVTITFGGTTYTTTTGTKTLTAPTVPTTVDYTITATAEGYTTSTATIKVVNVPKLTIILPSGKVYGTKEFTVTVADDAGSAIIGAKVTFNSADYYTGAGGSVTITAPDVKETSTDYTLTATFTGFESASTATLKIYKTQGGIPGFELVTLIAAIGVALILLRRRRN